MSVKEKEIDLKGNLILCLSFAMLLYAEEDRYCGCILSQEASIVAKKIQMNFDGKYEMLFTLSDSSIWMTEEDETFLKIIDAGWALSDELLLINELEHYRVYNITRASEVILTPLCRKPG
jgi:hypothetical protein